MPCCVGFSVPALPNSSAGARSSPGKDKRPCLGELGRLGALDDLREALGMRVHLALQDTPARAGDGCCQRENTVACAQRVGDEDDAWEKTGPQGPRELRTSLLPPPSSPLPQTGYTRAPSLPSASTAPRQTEVDADGAADSVAGRRQVVKGRRRARKRKLHHDARLVAELLGQDRGVVGRPDQVARSAAALDSLRRAGPRDSRIARGVWAVHWRDSSTQHGLRTLSPTF